MAEIYNTRGDESSCVIDSTVGRSFGKEQPQLHGPWLTKQCTGVFAEHAMFDAVRV